MNDMDRALAPLQEARAAIATLETYTSPRELAGALEAIGQAVERSLRQLLRRDASLPDEVRLNALDSAALPFERVIVALRQRDRISLDAAHCIHELESARRRAHDGQVRAADADAALRAVAALERELRQGPRAAADATLRASAHAAVERGELDAPPHEVPANEQRSWQRRGVLLALTLIVLAIITYIVITLFSGASPLEQGVAAYQAERYGIAERHFREALEDSEAHATAALYLGRLLRRQERSSEAATVLNEARKRHPDDADILRELGYLLARDLRRPAAAVEPFRRAVELEPEQSANWIALVSALRAANDPSAEQWLARAPAEARAALRGSPRQ